MPTDTIDAGMPRPIDVLLDEFLASEPEGDAARAAQHLLRGLGQNPDVLVDLLASALHRGERGTVPNTTGFLDGGGWTLTPEQQIYTRTYSAAVPLRIAPVSASEDEGGWLVFIGGQLLRHADGSVAVFDTPAAAMQSADRVMTEMKTTVAIPAAP